MDSLWRTSMWKQFCAAIDMLDNAVTACPDSLWRARLWPVSANASDSLDSPLPPESAEFWYIAYHALFWLDLYRAGAVDGFAPPAPFTLEELDPAGVVPARHYTREELRAYLAITRQKCQAVLERLTDGQARQPVTFPWMREGEVVTYAELQMYSMRHTQEHAAQLNLTLGQHGVPDADLRWVPRAKDDPGGR